MRKTFYLSVFIFLVLMGVLFYVEFGLSTPKASAEKNSQPAIETIETTGETSAEKEIRAILEKYYEIARTNNREALINYSREITAPEYRYSSELGKMDKQEAFRHFESVKIEFLSADFDDFSVQVFGDDTAIAKYRDFSKVRAGVEVMKTPVRFTNVWIKRDGKWLVVAEHSSALAPPKLLPRHPLSDHWAGELIDRRMALLF